MTEEQTVWTCQSHGRREDVDREPNGDLYHVLLDSGVPCYGPFA